MRLTAALSDPEQRGKAVLAFCVLAGLATVAFYALLRPSPANTFGVFYLAAKASMSGPVDYRTPYGLYVYTPVTLLFFYPYVLAFDQSTALLVHRVLSVCLALGFGVVLARFLRREIGLSGRDQVLVAAFACASLYPVVDVVLGGIEIVLGAALGIGWIALERRRDGWGGVAWALASLFKVFPSLWGLYMLRAQRLRAVVAAVVAGAGATILGVAIFGLNAYLRYFHTVTTGRIRLFKFAGGASPDNEMVTPVRPLAQIFPHVAPTVWPPVIFVVVALLLGFVYLRVPTDELTDRATLLLATVIAITFVMPTSQDLDMYYLYAPLVVVLLTERRNRIHAVYSIGTVIYMLDFSQNELRPLLAHLGLSHVGIMAVADPFLRFATMPLYGLFVLFAAILLRALRSDYRANPLSVLE